MLSAHFPPRKQKRFHGDHSKSDVVMLVTELLRRFLLVVNDWDSASHRSLLSLGSDGTVVTCTICGVTMVLVSNEPRLLDLLAAAPRRGGRLERRTIAKCARQHTCGVVGSGKVCAV